MKTLRSLSLAVTSLASLASFGAACAPASDPGIAEDVGAAEAQALTAVSAQTGTLTITLEGAVRFDERNGQQVLVIKGRSNRNLTSARSWVPDDVFGETTLITPRRFEVVLHAGYEANSILSGLPLNMTFDVATGTTTTAYARIVLGASFARFSGSSMLFIDKAITPVMVRSETDNLFYRGAISANRAITSLAAHAQGGGDPTTTRVDADTFRIDWRYTDFVQAADPHTVPVVFDAVLAGGLQKQKRAGIDVVVSSLDLTTEDPEIAFATECDPDVYQCIQAADAAGNPDLGHCGTYRQALRCSWLEPGEICEIEGTRPYELVAFDASGTLDPITDAYDAECQSGFTWCSADVVGTFNVPACVEPAATLDAAVQWIAAHDQNFVPDGAVGSRIDVAATSLFSHGQSGPALLGALDTIAGSTNVEAYHAAYEIPCHNCHTFADYVILFYPDSGVVAVLQGTHGYDS